MSVLQVNQLSKNFGKIQALNQVSFEVPQGSVFGILGPNGSGKTTLLSIVTDVLKPTTGNFFWFGKASNAATRKQIGTLLETPNFYPYLRVTIICFYVKKSIKGVLPKKFKRF